MKNYVLVGASSRALWMYALPLSTELKDHARVVGIFDANMTRARYISGKCGGIPVYPDFQVMVRESEPHAAIITVIDRLHHEYIVKSLEAGLETISEKPMTIDAPKCRAILEAEKRTGGKVTVTFNLRFMPFPARIKEIIRAGAVGEILGVDFEWMLDTGHGADYFRRWHRYLRNSGGLLVHKATHHFDLINWWLDDSPRDVFAFGARRFYGPTRKERGERCLTCRHARTCEFYWDIRSDEMARDLYLNAEKEDGYFRDRCVFAEDIDIYDTMSVNVRYARGAFLTYSLVAHSPYEGWKVALSGTDGRLEASQYYSGSNAGDAASRVQVFNRRGETITYEIPNVTGGHGGADERLRRMLFVGDLEDPLEQKADSMAGAYSLLIGASANLSIAEGRTVSIESLLRS